MLLGFNPIGKVQQAVYSQTEFLIQYTTKWKEAPMHKETDQEALTQLVPTIFYLREGLGDIYLKEEGFIRSTLGSTAADEFKMKHQLIIDTIDGMYRSLLSLKCQIEQLNKENIWDIMYRLCQSINQLSREENQFSYLESIKS